MFRCIEDNRPYTINTYMLYDSDEFTPLDPDTPQNRLAIELKYG